MGEVIPPKGIAIRIIPPEEIKTREILPKTELEKELTRGLSEKSAKAYNFYISKLLESAGKNSTKEINQEDLENYYFSLSGEISNGTRQMILSALKYRFPKFDYSELKVGRLSKKLPDILTIEEIELLINNTENKKHKFMIRMFYSTGIRLSELINLRYKDVYVEENAIKIIFGKEKKDRFVTMAKEIKDDLVRLKSINLPTDYIFSVAGHKMSERAVQRAIQVSVMRSGIQKDIHVHSLRHAYATHLYESGVTIEKIQLLLGHENVSTTMRYVHVSKKSIMEIRSPLDLLRLNKK